MKFLVTPQFFFSKIEEGALMRQSSIEQLKKIRKISKGIDIGDRVPNLKKQGANIHYYQNPIDTGIESYEDFEKHNKKFIPGWNTKHLLSPFKEKVTERKILDFFKSEENIHKEKIIKNERLLELIYRNIRYLRFLNKKMTFDPETSIKDNIIITQWNDIKMFYFIEDDYYELVLPKRYNLRIFEMIYDLLYDYSIIISVDENDITRHLKFKEKYD